MTTFVRTEVCNAYDDERHISIYSCNRCGNEWDGNAQCICYMDDEEYQVSKRKASMTEDVIVVDIPPSPTTKKVKTTVTYDQIDAERQINEILDTLPPDVAEKVSSRIAIRRKIL